MKTKICTKCGIEKNIEDYRKSKTNRYGCRNICKLCNSILDKEYRERNKEAIAKKQEKYYLERKNRAKVDPTYESHLKEISKRSCKNWCSKNKKHLAEYKRRITNTEDGKLKKSEADRKYRKKLKEERPEEYSEIVKKKGERRRGRLLDVYVVSLIKTETGLPTEEIREHPELIKAKRQTIKIKRLCRT